MAKSSLGSSILVSLIVVLAGCSVTPEPYTELDQEERAKADYGVLFDQQEAVSGAVTLEEAVARALKFNLDRRLLLMEEAISMHQLGVLNFDALPQVVANAGYNMRSNRDRTYGANSAGKPIKVNQNGEPLRGSTSSDKNSGAASLSITWNLLDFGVGYLRAKQQSDRALMAQERRRQVIHNIIREVRATYWRSAAAERMLRDFDEVYERVQEALDVTSLQVSEGIQQLDTLLVQRSLLEAVRKLEDLREEVQTAKIELSILMNVHPRSEFTIAGADVLDGVEMVKLGYDAGELEYLAIVNDSGVRMEAYDLRAVQQESKIALLQMIPGVNISAGLNKTTDEFKVNQNWFSTGMQLTWNLVHFARGISQMDLAEAQEEVTYTRRLALTMSVIAKVNVALAQMETARRSFDLANRLYDVETQVLTELENLREVEATSEIKLIQGEVDALVVRLERDMAYADFEAAYGQIIATISADPFVVPAESTSVADLAAAFAVTLERWNKGDFVPVRGATMNDGEAAPMGDQTAPVDGEAAPAEESEGAAAEEEQKEQTSALDAVSEDGDVGQQQEELPVLDSISDYEDTGQRRKISALDFAPEERVERQFETVAQTGATAWEISNEWQ